MKEICIECGKPFKSEYGSRICPNCIERQVDEIILSEPDEEIEEETIPYAASCPFCGKVTKLALSSSVYSAIQCSDSISKVQGLSAAERELFITGMCFDCQEKTFHVPSPEHAEEWGPIIGECDVCGANIYEHKDKKGNAHMCYQCKTVFSK